MKKILAVFVLVILAGAVCFGQDEPKIKARNALVEAEITLAKTAGTYMVIDLEDRSVSLKARGMVLRKWAIKKTRFWGKAVPIAAYKLEKKSALSQPERPNITPGKEEQEKAAKGKKEAFDLGVLELKDMPVHFSLDFGQGIHLSIRPKTKRFWPALLNVGKTLSRLTFLPLKTVWFAVRKKSFTDIEIVMPSEKDAQGIYWSFLDKQNTLIFQPIK